MLHGDSGWETGDMTRVERAAAAVRKAGFEVLLAEEPDDTGDGQLTISERLTVQVGANYYSVVEETIDEAFIFVDCGNSLPQVITALRENVARFQREGITK